MGGQPDNLSSFCFLSKTEKIRLDGLMGDIDKIVTRIVDQVQEADEEVSAISQVQNPEPKRNPLENGSLHEKRWTEWTRRNFEQTSQMMRTQWESDAQVVDDLGELIRKQEEVKNFLQQVDAKTPAVGHRNTRRLAELMQPEKRATLGHVYQKMREFANAQMQPVFDGQLEKLQALSKHMKELEAQKEAYWPESGKLRTAGNIKGYIALTAQTKALAKELNMVEPAIVFTVSNLPSFDAMKSSYQQVMHGTPAQRA